MIVHGVSFSHGFFHFAVFVLVVSLLYVVRNGLFAKVGKPTSGAIHHQSFLLQVDIDVYFFALIVEKLDAGDALMPRCHLHV